MNDLRKSVLAFLFISSLVLVHGVCKGQSILMFENIKDSTNTYQLPLGKFPVQLKYKDSIAFKAVIDNATDTTLSVRVYKSSRAIDSIVNKLRAEFNKTLAQQKRKRKYRDSLRKELDANILAAKYSIRKEVRIARVKTVTIYNQYIPEKKKQIRWANAASVVFLGATLLSASTQNPYYIGVGIGLTAIAFISKASLSTKDLDLIIPKRAKKRKQWKIKGVRIT